MFPSPLLVDANFHEYLFDIIENERAIKYKIRAGQVLGQKIVAPLIKGKKHRLLLTDFTDKLRTSKMFRDRQIYVHIAIATYKGDNDIFKKHFSKNIAADFESEKCKCVLNTLAMLCSEVPEAYSKSLDKIRTKLLDENDDTVLQYMLSNDKGIECEKNRRFIPLNYGSAPGEAVDEEKQITEEEWLAKEQKEIEEVEKTVNIRFANYTTLMRAHTLTQGLSAQLAMFLTSINKDGDVAKKPDKEPEPKVS